MSCDDLLHITGRNLPDTPLSGQHCIEVTHQGYLVTYFWHMGEKLCGWIVDSIVKLETVE